MSLANSHMRTISLATCFIVASGCSAFAGSSYWQMPAKAGDRMVVVLDSSGSMADRLDGARNSKMAIARTVLRRAVKRWSKSNQKAGLLAYGHRSQNYCGDIQTLVPWGEVNGLQFTSALRQVEPLGKTPLTEAIKHGAKALDYKNRPATVVLLTDGRENCGRNPCLEAGAMAKEARNLKVHVIGFDVDRETEAELRCVADATNGRYVSANNADSLFTALKLVSETKKPSVLGRAELRLPSLEAGRYELIITVDGNLKVEAAPETDRNLELVGRRSDFWRSGKRARLHKTKDRNRAIERLRQRLMRERLDQERKSRGAQQIAGVGIRLAAPDRVAPSETFDLTWKGSMKPGDKLVLLPSDRARCGEIGAMDLEVAHDDAGTQGRVRVRAPRRAGRYAVLYCSGRGRAALAQVTLDVENARRGLRAANDEVYYGRAELLSAEGDARDKLRDNHSGPAVTPVLEFPEWGETSSVRTEKASDKSAQPMQLWDRNDPVINDPKLDAIPIREFPQWEPAKAKSGKSAADDGIAVQLWGHKDEAGLGVVIRELPAWEEKASSGKVRDLEGEVIQLWGRDSAIPVDGDRKRSDRGGVPILDFEFEEDPVDDDRRDIRADDSERMPSSEMVPAATSRDDPVAGEPLEPDRSAPLETDEKFVELQEPDVRLSVREQDGTDIAEPMDDEAVSELDADNEGDSGTSDIEIPLRQADLEEKDAAPGDFLKRRYSWFRPTTQDDAGEPMRDDNLQVTERSDGSFLNGRYSWYRPLTADDVPDEEVWELAEIAKSRNADGGSRVTLNSAEDDRGALDGNRGADASNSDDTGDFESAQPATRSWWTRLGFGSDDNPNEEPLSETVERDGGDAESQIASIATGNDGDGDEEVDIPDFREQLAMQPPVSRTVIGPKFSRIAPVKAGFTFKVAWESPKDRRDWIAIAKAGENSDNYLALKASSKTGTIELRAPSQPGDYEVRYISSLDGRMISHQAFVVEPAEVKLVALEFVETGDEMRIWWVGPGHTSDKVTLARPGMADDNYLLSRPIIDGNPIFLEAPNEPGKYEVRYINGTEGVVMFRTQLTVTARQTALLQP